MAAVTESSQNCSVAELKPRILAALTPQPRTKFQLRDLLGIAPSDKAANAALSEALAALVADKQLVPIRDLYVRIRPDRSKKKMTTSTKQLPADVVLAAAFTAADTAAADTARKAEEAAKAEALKDQAEREDAAQRITKALAALGLPDVTLTADDLNERYTWEIVPGLTLTADRGEQLRLVDRWEPLHSLADLGAAIRKHQDLERQRQLVEAMEQSRPQYPSEPRFFSGAVTGTGIIFQPHDLTLTLRPIAREFGDLGKSFEISGVSAHDARALSDAIISAALRRESCLTAIGWASYQVVCAANALTVLFDELVLTVPLESDERDEFAATLQAWADHRDALKAWYDEVRKVAPNVWTE